MKRGWGYNAHRRSQDKIITDRLFKVFDNEKMKVYETKNNLFKGCYLDVRILFNKESKTIKVIITGKGFSGNRLKPIQEDVTELKTLKNIKEHIREKILPIVDR